jgi:LPXTG-motif cell wall-anchored protein
MEGTIDSSSQSNNSWIGLVLGAIGIYLIFRKKKNTKQLIDTKSSEIDSYSKFRKTPMGKSIEEQLDEQKVELSDGQIQLLDQCLQGLTEEDYRVINKASQFVKKEEILKALSKEEMKAFLPIRNKIINCLDETLTP